MNNSIIKVPVFINEDNIINGALEVLKFVRPEWDSADINFKLLTDGITNKLLACNLNGNLEEETILVRIYGNKTDLLIDRKAETRNILMLNELGLAPSLYATFENGLTYEFVPGTTLNVKTVADPKIYKLVATHMAKLHKVKVANVSNPKPILWTKMQRFLDLVPEIFSDPDKQSR